MNFSKPTSYSAGTGFESDYVNIRTTIAFVCPIRQSRVPLSSRSRHKQSAAFVFGKQITVVDVPR